MKKPTEIIINTTGVSDDDIYAMREDVLDPNPEQFSYIEVGFKIYVAKFRDLEAALFLMYHLESECWKWEDKYGED